jgi:hypothetical protein
MYRVSIVTHPCGFRSELGSGSRALRRPIGQAGCIKLPAQTQSPQKLPLRRLVCPGDQRQSDWTFFGTHPYRLHT